MRRGGSTAPRRDRPAALVAKRPAASTRAAGAWSREVTRVLARVLPGSRPAAGAGIGCGIGTDRLTLFVAVVRRGPPLVLRRLSKPLLSALFPEVLGDVG
jgi:hypothetical protein